MTLSDIQARHEDSVFLFVDRLDLAGFTAVFASNNDDFVTFFESHFDLMFCNIRHDFVPLPKISQLFQGVAYIKQKRGDSVNCSNYATFLLKSRLACTLTLETGKIDGISMDSSFWQAYIFFVATHARPLYGRIAS